MLNNAFLPLDNGQLELEVLVDKTLIELYGNGGLVYWFANHNQVNLDSFKISMFHWESELNPDPRTLVKSLEIHELKSIWQ